MKQNTLALLVDGTVLADKISAISVVGLIEDEVHQSYAGAELGVQALKKLVAGRPVTDGFLAGWIERRLSGGGVHEMIERVR